MIGWGTQFEAASGVWLRVGPVTFVCTPAWWRIGVGVVRVERRRWLVGVAVGPLAVQIGAAFRRVHSKTWEISWTPAPDPDDWFAPAGTYWVRPTAAPRDANRPLPPPTVPDQMTVTAAPGASIDATEAAVLATRSRRLLDELRAPLPKVGRRG